MPPGHESQLTPIEAPSAVNHSPVESPSASFINEVNRLALPGAPPSGKLNFTISEAGGESISLHFTPINFGRFSGQPASVAVTSFKGGKANTSARENSGSELAEADAFGRNTSAKQPGDQRNRGQTLAAVAESLDGQQLWRDSKYKNLTDHGHFGCAASLSIALAKAGATYADAPTVGALVEQLKNHGWTQHPANEARENDVMVAYNGTNWKNGGGHAHIGIVRADGKIYNNSVRRHATWIAEPPDVAFGHYEQRFVLRR